MDAMHTARHFASSLDMVDYDAAAAWLAPDCRYEVGDAIHVGPDAILASYRRSSDWASRSLDDIRYESIVRRGEQGSVIVEYIDHLTHAGKTHTHRCEQHLQFGEQGLITRIRHVDLAGEQEGVDRFLESVGVSKA